MMAGAHRKTGRNFVNSVGFPAWIVVLGVVITGVMILMGALLGGR
jgi:hypothetical protein